VGHIDEAMGDRRGDLGVDAPARLDRAVFREIEVDGAEADLDRAKVGVAEVARGRRAGTLVPCTRTRASSRQITSSSTASSQASRPGNL
jgi:hypothetical protein